MSSLPQDDTLLEKWKERTVTEKTEIIAAFLYEYGEHATWEDWRDFLRKHHAKGFEWIHAVD